MKNWKNIAASAVLAVAVAGSVLAGCGVNGKDTAIVVNDTTINVGTANFILRYQQAQAYSMMKMYGLQTGQALWDTKINNDSSSESASTSSSSESVSASSTSADSTSESAASSVSASSTSSASTSSTSEESYDTYGEQFRDGTVLKDIQKMVVLGEHLDEYGVSFTDEQETAIKDTAKSTYEKNEKILKDMGTTQDNVEEALRLMSYEYLIRPKLNAEVDSNISDDEAKQSTFTYARFSETQSDSSTGVTTIIDDETKATYQAAAEEILSQIKASGDVANADISSIATGVNSAASSSQASYGADDTTYPDEVKNALSGLTDGEVYDGVIDAGGYLWVVRLDKQFDPDATESQKTTILSQRQSDHYDETVDGWVAQSTMTVEKGWKKLKVTDEDEYSVLDTTTTNTTTTNTSSSSTEADSTTSVSTSTSGSSESAVSASSAQ
jgi:foldase protein PrsA